jgi:ribosomal protein S18 acetylase RimI-like enzyme
LLKDKNLNITYRNIEAKDIQLVHKFIVNYQGPSENERERSYLNALIEKGWLKIDGEIQFPKNVDTAPSKTDYLDWIVNNKDLHFGKIALVKGSIVGVLLCYTQSNNKKAYLSNIAVHPRYRRKGVGSTLMKALIDFYQHKRDVDFIETNTGYSNGIAVKLYLDHNFKIVELRDTGYNLRYALNKNKIPSKIRPYMESDFEDYALTLLETWPFDNIKEARENVLQAVKRVKKNENEEIWVAEVEGKAVGFILIGFSKIWGRKGESFDEEAVGIDWFDVDPKFQGKGIGKELLRTAEERGKEKGLHKIFMHTLIKNLKMMNFASKNGFRFTKYLEKFYGIDDAFLLVKQIL